ncbi:MAG: hypothetical protein AAGK32_18725 [Actinomycetota bacterium]
MAPSDDPRLTELGIGAGDRVRFRRRSGGWIEATVERREKDGSVGLRDGKGAARAITVDRLEVRTTGPRGGLRWQPLAERADETEQLRLL